MLDFHDAKRLNPQEVLTLFRGILKHLKTLPLAFEAQGVFRVSGTNQHIQQITHDILQNKSFVHRQYTVHDYVGVLKNAIINGNLVDMHDRAVVALKKTVASDDIAVGKDGVYDFINTLSKSTDKKHFMAAEIFYQFFHQLTLALSFQDKNKMSAANLGIIAGPFFADVIEDNPKHILDTTLKLNQICASLIKDGHFKNPFDSTFSELVEAWHENELVELEHARSQSPVETTLKKRSRASCFRMKKP